MKARIISPQSDSLVRELEKVLGDEGIELLPESAAMSGETRAYAPSLEGNFLMVDLRGKPDYQELANLHAQYPGTRLVCFGDDDGRAERTAMTFGGGDAFFVSSAGARAMVEHGIELAQADSPQKKYRSITGMQFSAGNVFIDTVSMQFYKLPFGHESIVKALSARGYAAPKGTLTEAECVVLEALKHRREETPMAQVTYEELTEALYDTRPKKNGLHTVISNLSIKFAESNYMQVERPFEMERKGLIPVGDRGVVLAPAYEDLG